MKLKEKKSKLQELKNLFQSSLGKEIIQKIFIERDGIKYRKYILEVTLFHSLYIEFNIQSEDFPSLKKQKLVNVRIYWKDVFEDKEFEIGKKALLYLAIRKFDPDFILEYQIFEIGDIQ